MRAVERSLKSPGRGEVVKSGAESLNNVSKLAKSRRGAPRRTEARG